MIFDGFTCDFTYHTEEGGGRTTTYKTTSKHNLKNVKDFIDDMCGLFGLDYASAELNTLKFQFTFAIIPRGGKATECR